MIKAICTASVIATDHMPPTSVYNIVMRAMMGMLSDGGISKNS